METTLTLEVAGMHCEGCISNIERSLARLSGVRTHSVEIGKVQVRFDESATSKAQVIAAIRSAGPYQFTSFSASRTG